MAWGRKCDLPDEMLLAKKSVADSGSGSEKKFMDYCNKQLRAFLRTGFVQVCYRL
jgi:retinol dehydrogenase-12